MNDEGGRQSGRLRRGAFGWRRELVETAARGGERGAAFDEIIKWGNLGFVHNGLCVVIHVEDHRVVFGFFRGKRLTGFEPRIKPSGKVRAGEHRVLRGRWDRAEQVERWRARRRG
jgi:hypothetical protein